MSLLSLPNEIILNISSSLTSPSLNSLLRTNRRLANLLPNPLVDSLFAFPSLPRAERLLFKHLLPTNDLSRIQPLVDRGILEIIGVERVMILAIITPSFMSTLLDCGIDRKNRESKQFVAISMACMIGNLQVLRMLVQRPDVDVNERDSRDNTPLTIVARYGRAKMVEILLADERVDVHAVGEYGRNALHQAVGQGALAEETIRVLLADGRIDEGARESRGMRAVDLAIKLGCKGVLGLLRERGRGPSAGDG